MKLTPRLRQVATLVAEGCDSKMIAKQLGLSTDTVKNLRCRVYVALSIPNPDRTWRRSYRQQITLGNWWSCELFQIGLKELGLIDEQPPQTRTLCA